MNTAVLFRSKRAEAWRFATARIGLLIAAAAFVWQPVHAEPSSVVTNVSQLTRIGSADGHESHVIRLEGDVWWSSPAQGRLVLRDTSGTAELELNLAGQPIRSGQRVRLEGNGTIARQGAAFRIGAKGAVVDNDGVHGMIEKSGAVYLPAGRHPIRVEWFNGVEKSGLQVDYAGPGLSRQRIPDTALFRFTADAAGGTGDSANGLEYRCYEVSGEVLPDFEKLTAVKTGTVANFDPGVAVRDSHVGLQFTGDLAVPQAGLYTFWTKSDDGSRLLVGEPTVRAEVTGTAEPPAPRRIAIGQTLREDEDGQWAELEGKVTFVREEPEGLVMELSAGAGRVRAELAEAGELSADHLLNSRLRATGFCQSANTTDGQKVPGVLLVPGRREIQFTEAPPHRTGAGADAMTDALPELTTAAEVHRLKREEAQRGYPVQFSGVVTCVLPERQAFTIQDATRGLYVEDVSENRSGPPEIGEYLEIEGTTDPRFFAPMVNARRVKHLGAGHLPEPVRPTWDQLMNGSLDAQYVELQGIVTAVQTNGITLLTREGVIQLELRVTRMKLEDVKRYEDALVRVRGCLLATWDYQTHQVKVGEIRVYGADILVDQPAPTDLFSSPEKTAAELLLFDPQASVFQRVKVSGQIVHVRAPEYFMMQGGDGLRFILKQPANLQASDEVEVVGFPELFGNVSPVLREAVARKTGQAPLPATKKVSVDDLIRADHDSTRVRVEGLLAGVRKTPSGQVLEMQSGVRTFAARLSAGDDAPGSLAVGSRLELTGVYAGQGGNRTAGQHIASFELLLNSPADIRVLARPPWWTLERLLIIVGALACVLAAAALWITQLHRQVEQRTAELGAQIQERQRVEHQRAMEQERARIAQDLHDELGSGITEISMLAARAKSASAPEEKRSGYLEQVGSKAREMVTALDEIVWAMNPGHDSLASLVSYFCLYADRFLGLAGIAWKYEGAAEPPDCVLNSRHRHQLFLAFKEALTNVVRHSGAAEVRLGIQVEAGQVRLTIADKGCGLSAGARTGEMNGVANMRSRIEKLGGRFEIASEPGRGTTLTFSVPAN
jgi:signal transduction histidine kinase